MLSSCFLRANVVLSSCFLRAFFVLSSCFLRAKVRAKIVGTKYAWSCKSSCKVFWHEECTIVPKSCKEFRHELCTTCQSRAKLRAFAWHDVSSCQFVLKSCKCRAFSVLSSCKSSCKNVGTKNARPCQNLCAFTWHDDALDLWYDAVVWTDKQTKGIQTFHKHKKGTFSVDIIRNWLKFSKSDYLINFTWNSDQRPKSDDKNLTKICFHTLWPLWALCLLSLVCSKTTENCLIMT